MMLDLSQHIGEWVGSWSTFLEPPDLYDESPVGLTVSNDGDAWLLSYAGSIAGDAVTGSLRWLEADGRIDVRWIDSWHTAAVEEHLEAEAGHAPSYRYGGDDPWTWDIAIDPQPGRLVITHHNAGPGIPRYVGILMDLHRP